MAMIEEAKSEREKNSNRKLNRGGYCHCYTLTMIHFHFNISSTTIVFVENDSRKSTKISLTHSLISKWLNFFPDDFDVN